MASPKPKQYPNQTGDFTPGNVQYTLNGAPVNFSVPAGTSSGAKAPTSTGSTLPRTTYNPITPHANAPSGTTTRLPGRTVYLNPENFEELNGTLMGQGTRMPQFGKPERTIDKQEKNTGGYVKPVMPEELANDIADAYDRMNAKGVGPYDNRFEPRIDELRGQRYGDYESQYLPKIDNLVDRLLTRDNFSYNWSDDPLYRQYAARYQQQARQGMQDTMGQAAALTGGYGNSYATAAANQAYANQMAGLNDRAMELYQLAAENYDRETSNLRNNLQQLEQREAANRSYYDTDRNVFYDRNDADVNNLLAQQQMDWNIYNNRLAQEQYDRDLAWQMYQYWNNIAESKYR